MVLLAADRPREMRIEVTHSWTPLSPGAIHRSRDGIHEHDERV